MKHPIVIVSLVAAVAATAMPSPAADPTPTPEPRMTPTPRATTEPSPTPTPRPTPTNAENTGRNVRDREKDAVTPIDQSNRAEDLKVTQEVRKAVMSDKSLSVNAKNAKIITTESKVVLRGPVNSAEEKSKLNEYAKAQSGARTVIDELEVRLTK